MGHLETFLAGVFGNKEKGGVNDDTVKNSTSEDSEETEEFGNDETPELDSTTQADNGNRESDEPKSPSSDDWPGKWEPADRNGNARE